MSGLLAIVSRVQLELETLDRLTESINLSQNVKLKSSKKDHYCFAVTSLRNTPLKGERLLESNKWIVLFSGDVVEHE